MTIKWFAVIFSLVLSGCQSDGRVEPTPKNNTNMAVKGTLANEKLTADTTAGLKKILGVSAFTPETKILKTVAQQPRGNNGARVWRERWFINAPDTKATFLITFTETGASGADFQIKRMNQPNPTPPESCPKNIGDYKVGQSTSQEIQTCLGTPYHENYNADGRYIYLYEINADATIAFVFDVSGNLIDTRGYKFN